jgi:protease-4
VKQFLISVAASFVAFCLVIAVGVTLLVGLAAGSLATMGTGQPELEAPEAMVLRLDLREPLTDRAQPNPFEPQPLAPSTSVVEIVRLLDRAAEDDRVKGLYLRLGAGLPVGQASELRLALSDFRASGKFAVAYAQSLFSPGLGDYYMAAAADEIWMQPESFVFASGVASQTPFMGELLSKIGVQAENFAREDYKNAFNVFSETGFTDAHREANRRLVDTIYDSVTAKIAADRGLDRTALTTLLDGVPYVTEEAVALDLIDRAGYPVDAEEAVKTRAVGADLVDIDRYARMLSPKPRGEKIIALVHGQGAIVEGDVDGGLFGGADNFGGDTVAGAILKAAEDEDVAAIVFRVSSPGGSAVASDQILNALERAKAAGKPVVVSMGDVAASGGYWVAMAADRIVAHETTVTGSIGVVFGRFATRDLFDRVGINMEEMSRGERALFFSSIDATDSEDREAVNKFLDVVYEGFTNRVADGRDLSRAQVREIAQGRVWSGVDAKRLDLIDRFGGLNAAVAEARVLAGLEGDPVLVTYPEPRPFIELLLEAFGSGGPGQALRVVDAALRDSGLQTILDLLSLGDEGVVAVEPTRVE